MNNTISARSIRENKRRCPLCSRSFSKTEHLERHVRSHTKEKPFECLQCGRKYGRNDSLLRHMKDQHPVSSGDDAIHGSGLEPLPTATSVVPYHPEDEVEMDVAQRHLDAARRSDTSMSLQYPTDPAALELPSSAQEHQPPTYLQNLSHDNETGLDFGDWLTDENFGNAMHTWPFVVDEHDLPHPANNPTTLNGAKAPADLQSIWYTHLEDDGDIQSGQLTPLARQKDIDDDYRQSLHRRLQVRSIDQNLPSVEYMNLSLHAYFRRFDPVFPIVHAATFVPSKTNSVLLLSICSIGSLLTGHPDAYQRGVQLFERLHKAILAHWERLMTRGPEVALAVVQASLIGQTFGLLSGKAKHLATVDAFHGTVISLARRSKFFQIQHTSIYDSEDLDRDWRRWIRTEEKIRVVLGLRIHDAEIAGLMHHEPFLSHGARTSQVASDTLFAASSAQEWFALYERQSSRSLVPMRQSAASFSVSQNLAYRLSTDPGHSHFNIYVVLEDTCSEIIEARMNAMLTTTSVVEIQDKLIQIYEHHLREPHFEPLINGSKILWHYLFILLHSDLNFLEKSIGRDGSSFNAADYLGCQKWANTPSAKRCAAHAIMIRKLLECFPLNSDPAIHVPRCAFAGVICLFCFLRYGNNENDFPADFNEFNMLKVSVDLLLKEVACFSSTDAGMSILYGFRDMLKRIGHWEISRTFASIIGVLLQSDST